VCVRERLHLDEFTTQDTLFALSKGDSVLSDITCGTRLRAFFFFPTISGNI
jgi:hypothetical protein